MKEYMKRRKNESITSILDVFNCNNKLYDSWI